MTGALYWLTPISWINSILVQSFSLKSYIFTTNFSGAGWWISMILIFCLNIYVTLYYSPREETSNIDSQSNFASLACCEHWIYKHAIIKNRILAGQNERRPAKNMHENLFDGNFCFKLLTAIFFGYRQGRNWRDD